MWFDILKLEDYKEYKWGDSEYDFPIESIEDLAKEVSWLTSDDFTKELGEEKVRLKEYADELKVLEEQMGQYLEQKKKFESFRGGKFGPKTRAKIEEVTKLIKSMEYNIWNLKGKMQDLDEEIKEVEEKSKIVNDPLKLIEYAAKWGVDLKNEDQLTAFLRFAKLRGLEIEEADFISIMPQSEQTAAFHEQEEIPKDKIQMVAQMYRNKNNKFPSTDEIIEMLDDEYGIAPTRWDYRADEKLKEIYSGQVWKQILRD
tara:strand:- start:155 stop:925 length:771 start_codon:yes stop_codon:yes gene_type:complete